MKKEELNNLFKRQGYVSVIVMIVVSLLLFIVSRYYDVPIIIDVIVILLCLFFILLSVLNIYRFEKIQNETLEYQKFRSLAIYSASKELSGLMNVIKNYSNPVIFQNYNPKQLQDALLKINDSSSFVMHIISDLLVLCDIKNNVKEETEKPDTINNCIQSSIDVMTTRLEKHSQSVEIVYNDVEKYRYILLHRAKFQRILSNLVRLVSRHTEDYKTITMIVSGEKQEGNTLGLKIELTSDTPIEDHFIKDLQGAKDIHEIDNYNELNLIIIGQLIQETKGTISFSEDKKHITLSYELLYYNNENMFIDYSILRGKNVLLADSDEMSIEVLQTLLNQKEINLDIVRSASDVFDIFTHTMPSTYDAIILDTSLEENSYETSLAIRRSSHPEATLVPIIALTGDLSHSEEMIKEAMMDAYITKPIDPDDLYSALTNNMKSF